MPDRAEIIRDLARILRIQDRHLDVIAQELSRGAVVDPQEVERFLVKAVIAENRLIGTAG